MVLSSPFYVSHVPYTIVVNMTLVLGTFVTVRGEYLHLHGLLGIRIGLQMCQTIFVYVLVFLFLLPFNMLQEVPTILLWIKNFGFCSDRW